MKKLLCLICLATLACVTSAQDDEIRIEFSEPGQREVWTGPMPPTGEPETTPATGDAIEIERPESDQWLFVYDLESGNVIAQWAASLPTEGAWSIEGAEPTYVYSVTVIATHEDQPVANGMVVLTAGEQTRRSTLGPDDEGKATFYIVPLGEVEAVLEYDLEGEDHATEATIRVLEAERDEPSPLIAIAVGDPIETIAPAEEETPAEAEPAAEEEQPEDQPSPWSRLGSYVIALAIVGAVVYFAYRYVTDHPDRVKQGLAKVGIEPQEQDDSPPPEIPQRQESQPIVLEGADPMAAAPAAAPTPAGPRLTGPGGEFKLNEGANTVGREGAVDVLIQDETVSRNHAAIRIEADQVILSDLGSTNGTFVNGQQLEGDTMLKPGDRVQFGRVQMRFEN